MRFIKKNKALISMVALFSCVFLCLQYVSCNYSDSVDKLLLSTEKERKLINSINDDLVKYDGLKIEFDFSINDLENLAKIEKEQNRFWSNILNSNSNIFSSWKEKSSESINADLTKLYSKLRETCSSNNIVFNKTTNNNFPSFDSQPANTEKKYGFGLSSYDGFWPSFSKDEARLLGIQSTIITQIIQFLAASSNDDHTITLLEIFRESVGEVDSQHIDTDQLSVPNLETKVVRFNDGIESFVFLIKFNSHTSHARSFINQLRPPFLIRDLVVSRTINDTVFTKDQPKISPFGNNSDNVSKQLPIVQNVESQFTVIIEYITKINRDVKVLSDISVNNLQSNHQVLKNFLELSGNDEHITKFRESP